MGAIFGCPRTFGNLRYLVPGSRRRSEVDFVPVQDLPLLQQGASVSGLPRAAVRDRGGEPCNEAGDQVVGLQKSSHPDGGWRCGKMFKSQDENTRHSQNVTSDRRYKIICILWSIILVLLALNTSLKSSYTFLPQSYCQHVRAG